MYYVVMNYIYQLIFVLYIFIQLYMHFYCTQVFPHLSERPIHQVLFSAHSVADKLIDLQQNMIPNIAKMH